MGFKVPSAFSNDALGTVLAGVLAGLGIWTKPAPQAKPEASPPPASRNQSQNTVQNHSRSNVFPLRVIRVNDTSSSTSVLTANMPKMAGRMVISGRMADVCAELDRLAA